MDYHLIFLFQGLTEADIDQMERGRCLRRKAFARRQTIFHTGDTVHEIGIVLRGAVHIESIDLWGSKSILSEVGEGQAFAETYAFCGEPLMVDVLAAADCEVLFLDTAALARPHAEHSWQDRLLRNLLRVSMKKNLTLSRRILCTAPKTVRGRLLTYLSGQAVQAGGMEFDLPFNRQQLADYLNLDRSALSKELCRMRDEGLLTFRKNHFVLRQLPELLWCQVQKNAQSRFPRFGKHALRVCLMFGLTGPCPRVPEATCRLRPCRSPGCRSHSSAL